MQTEGVMIRIEQCYDYRDTYPESFEALSGFPRWKMESRMFCSGGSDWMPEAAYGGRTRAIKGYFPQGSRVHQPKLNVVQQY